MEPTLGFDPGAATAGPDPRAVLDGWHPLDLVREVPGLTEEEARRVLAVAHRAGSLPPVTPTGVRRLYYHQLRDRFRTGSMTVLEEKRSSVDPFVKYLFQLEDGQSVETVRIPLERPGRFVACVSSQVGCGIGCSFCGTARLGLRRNLTVWEITGQVRELQQRVAAEGRIHGVVFQGMGEPLANLDAVLGAIRLLSEPWSFAIDGGNITISTSGVASRLERLMAEAPSARLALSIGSARPELRRKLIPLEDRFPLATVVTELARLTRGRGVAPLFAYTLLDGVNDSDADAEALVVLAERFRQEAGVAARVSLIRYNTLGEGDSYRPSTEERLERFRELLAAARLPVVRRYSGGGDVGAACGQLGLERAGLVAPERLLAEAEANRDAHLAQPGRSEQSRLVEG